MPLVGGNGECALLDGLLDGVHRSGAALLVRGEPGIGKSALLDHAAEQASARGFRVLRTLGVHAETDMPYSGLQQLLRPLEDGHARLPAVQRGALRTAFGLAEGPPAQPFLVGLATLTLLTDAAADQPVLVVVDDLHWLDPLSATVLTFVARRVEHDRVVVIGSVRSGPVHRDVGAALAELELTGLADADAAALLGRVAPDLPAAVRDRIRAEARGNPLALLELPLAHRAAVLAGTTGAEPALVPMTDRLERAFGDRLATLPAPAAAVLLVAALTTTDELTEILAAATALAGARAAPGPSTPPWPRVWSPPARRRCGSATPSSGRPSRGPRRRPAGGGPTPPSPRCSRATRTAAPGTSPCPPPARTTPSPPGWRRWSRRHRSGAGPRPRRSAASNWPPSSRPTAPGAAGGSCSPPSAPAGSATPTRWRGCSPRRSRPPARTSTTSSAPGSGGWRSSPAGARR